MGLGFADHTDMVGPGGLGPCTGGPGAAPRHGPPGAGGAWARPASPGELQLEGGGRRVGGGAAAGEGAGVTQKGACKGAVRGGGDKQNETLDETKHKSQRCERAFQTAAHRDF